MSLSRPPGGRRPVAGFAVVTLAAVLVACSGSEPPGAPEPGPTSTSATTSTPPTPTQPPPADLDGCVTADDATMIFDAGASTTANVAIMGTGDVGVVISYEVSRFVCPWLPLAERLVDAGYRVLLYDTVSGTATNHVVDRAALLRAQGVDEVVLVGGSLGGAASIVAATMIDPPVAAVVSLSGGGIDTTEAATRLTVPMLQIVSADDAPFAGVASQNDGSATGSPAHELVVLPGRVHASGLFGTGDADTVITDILDFLAAHSSS